MITEANELSSGARRRLRLNVETYYDVQEVRIQTDHRVRNYAEEEGLAECIGEAEVDRLRNLGDKNVAYKKAIRELKDTGNEQFDTFAQAFLDAKKKLESEDKHKKVNDLMAAQEKIIMAQCMEDVSGHPLWETWLKDVSGIGPCLAGGILAWINIAKSEHVGQLWKYCGLAVTIDKYVCPKADCAEEFGPQEIKSVEERVAAGEPHEAARCPKCRTFLRQIGHADRRQKGQVTGYNPKVKTLCWKIAESFVKRPAEKSAYRRVYDDMRKLVDSRPCNKVHKDTKTGKVVPCFDAHRFAKAKRLTVKIFISHVYKMLRSIHGLPSTNPYSFGMLGKNMDEYLEPMSDAKE